MKHPADIPARPLQLALSLVLLVAPACDRAQQQATADLPPALQAMSDVRPETPVVTATAPQQREIAPVRVEAGLQQPPVERVRLTRDGLLLDRPLRFAADLVAVGADSLVLSDGYTLTHRLPEGHVPSLEVGRRYVVDFRPTSVGGSDEVSATVYEAAGQEPQAGPVVMQAVQRGGVAPVRIVEESFVVEQVDIGPVVVESESEITTRPGVRLTSGQGRWLLVAGEPREFQAAGGRYRASLLRSLHFQVKPGRQSDEGPTFFLEYVVTRLGR